MDRTSICQRSSDTAAARCRFRSRPRRLSADPIHEAQISIFPLFFPRPFGSVQFEALSTKPRYIRREPGTERQAGRVMGEHISQWSVKARFYTTYLAESFKKSWMGDVETSLLPSTSPFRPHKVLDMDRREFTKLSVFALASTCLPSYAQSAGFSQKPVGYAAIGLGTISDIF